MVDQDNTGNLIGDVHMGTALRYKDKGEWHIRDDEDGKPRVMDNLWAGNLWYIVFYVSTVRVQQKNPNRWNIGVGNKVNLTAIYSLYGE